MSSALQSENIAHVQFNWFEKKPGFDCDREAQLALDLKTGWFYFLTCCGAELF